MSAITELLRRINDPAGSLTGLLSVIKEEPDHAPRPLASPAPSGDTPPRATAQVIDVSDSMGKPDYEPTRLEGAIRAAVDYVNARRRRSSDDRIAVIAFHSTAEVVLPLTAITQTKQIIEALHSLRASGGTDIAQGLKAAAKIFAVEPPSGHRRHIILLSDGHGGKPLRIARKLKDEYDVVIDVVGIGGSPDAVNESLLRRVATTDPDGFCHYRFIKDSAALSQYYRQLAAGLIWRDKEDD